MKGLFALAVGLVWWSVAGVAQATIVGCETFTAGKVVLNLCDNHDYFPRSQPFRARLEAQGLERLRLALVRARKLPDATILVEHQPWRSGTPQITRRTDCQPDAGDSDRPSPSLGACIHIAAQDLPRRWSTLRTALVAATSLSAKRPTIELTDLAALGRRHRADRYLGVVVIGRRYAAPGKSWAVRERWQDGRLGFQLIRRGGVVRQVALTDMITSVPQWSQDGKQVAFATLSDVTRFRLADGRTTRFDVTKRLPKDASHFDTRLRWSGAAVDVAADTAMAAGYIVWRWSPDDGKVEVTQKDGDPPF